MTKECVNGWTTYGLTADAGVWTAQHESNAAANMQDLLVELMTCICMAIFFFLHRHSITSVSHPLYPR